MITALMYLGGALGVASVVVLAMLVARRLMEARRERRLRAFIIAYAEARGGTVRFDDQGRAHVEGPLGSGHKSLSALRDLVRGRPDSEWEGSVGRVFRAYLPDEFQRAFTEAAADRLSSLGPSVAALGLDELRRRLRVRVGSPRADGGLVTCARTLSDRFEARIVVDGIALEGLPTADRERLGGTDEELFLSALDNTLEEPPMEAACGQHAWLCRPGELFGPRPVLAVGDGPGLRWIPIDGQALGDLARLCDRSSTPGAMKAVLWAWDGVGTLVQSTILIHTAKGSVDYTLHLPHFATAALGVHAPDGRVDVRR